MYARNVIVEFTMETCFEQSPMTGIELVMAGSLAEHNFFLPPYGIGH